LRGFVDKKGGHLVSATISVQSPSYDQYSKDDYYQWPPFDFYSRQRGDSYKYYYYADDYGRYFAAMREAKTFLFCCSPAFMSPRTSA